MTQITFRGQAATVATTTEPISTGNVQQMPEWAPPVEYIGTTSPWKVNYVIPTTTTGSSQIGQAKVYQYGNSSTIHSGVDVFTTDMATALGTKKPLMTVTYIAVGELVRPI